MAYIQYLKIKQNQMQRKKLALRFRNITVTASESVNMWTKRCFQSEHVKTLVNDVSGKFKTGKLYALIGPSGSGKTTFINTLIGQTFSNNIEAHGDIFVNQQRYNNLSDFGHGIGYVRQNDSLFTFFTPKQTFEFFVNLKMNNLNTLQKNQIINNIIEKLDMIRCKDTYIQNLSGGERKRTSIGVELATNPDILFLDQPTTGLDSSTAFKIIQDMKKLTQTGKTIITTLHQPSSNIFNLIDELILLLDGNIVYNGSAKESINYFKKIYGNNFINLHQNPLDAFMRVMSKECIAMRYSMNLEVSDQEINLMYLQNIENLKRKLSENQEMLEKAIISSNKNVQLKEAQKIPQQVNNSNVQIQEANQQQQKYHQNSTVLQENQLIQSYYQANWFLQCYFICNRSFWNNIRNKTKMIFKFTSFSFIIGFLMTVLYYKKADKYYIYDEDLSSLGFYYSFLIAFFAIFDDTMNFSSQRDIYIREVLSKYYSPSAYYAANIISSFPINVFVILLVFTPAYFLLNLNHKFECYVLTMILMILLYVMMMRFCLILAIIIESQVTLSISLPIFLAFNSLLAGFFVPHTEISDAFLPIEAISLLKYSYQAFIQIQYQFDNNQIEQYQDRPENPLQLSIYSFREDLWLNFFLIIIIGFLSGILDFIVLKKLGDSYRLNVEQINQNLLKQQIQISVNKKNLKQKNDLTHPYSSQTCINFKKDTQQIIINKIETRILQTEQLQLKNFER